MTGKILPFTPTPRCIEYYELEDDFLTGESSTIYRGDTCEVLWDCYAGGDLHALDMADGTIIFRYMRRVMQPDGWPALETHGGDPADRELISVRSVRRFGLVARVYSMADDEYKEIVARPLLRLTATG